MSESTFPADTLFAVTPHNTNDLPAVVRQLYVGTGGDVTVITDNNITVTFKNVGSGSTIGPFFVKRVTVTNTTASNIVGFV